LAERFFDGRLGRPRILACLAVTGLLGATAVGAGVGLFVWDYSPYPHLARPARALATLFVAGGAAVLASFGFRRRKRVTATTALFSMVVVVYLLGAVWVLPAANENKSPRDFCKRVDAVVEPGQDVFSYGMWTWRAGYAFYLRRPIPNLKSVEELRNLWARDEQVFLIVEDEKLDEARRILGDGEPWVRARMGRDAAYLFTNR
jgi:hypothetical protein